MLAPIRGALEAVAPVARPVTSLVTGLGWLLLGCAVAAWGIAGLFDWAELALIGWLLIVLFALCVLLTIGRTDLRVTVQLEPSRVRVGETSSGRVDVLNRRRGRLPPIALELPVGESAGRFNMPSIGSGQFFTEVFTVPTDRRGVIPIGPATTVRGDPFGFLRRSVRWTELLELFVHPRMVAVEPLDSGLLRDLEGRTTNDISVSDLAFHALREYSPGDDRRYIHWRSSAKASAGIPNSKFLVRQFLDTRRSHLTLVVDGDEFAYRTPEDFETAISAAASVAVRAIRDEIQTTVVASEEVVHVGTPQRTLDGFARAQPSRRPLATLALEASRIAPATSVALIISGAFSEFSDIRRAAAHFPIEVNTVVLRVDPERPSGISTVSDITVLSVADLADLPRLLRAGPGE
ncbi:Uncharacterized conserved protein, DUF58 family, contains vWF domain [Frankineae bacterium MT45]|nr:Uncharacterized conserved protein, DUF58 family, contains vWF domain [Frankineae bacterium MT45]